MKTCFAVIVLALFAGIYACADGTNSSKETDLLAYGIPITLETPDSVDIKTQDWGLQKDITLQGDDGYNLQIFSSMATSTNLKVVVSEHKELVRGNPYFNKFVSEDDAGFLFEVMVDSAINYDFRHIKIEGDREYIFQTGLLGNFTLAQAEELYRISKEAR